MATSKTLTPTNVTISIPAFTDKPDQRVNSNCIDKEADAINALSDQIANVQKYAVGALSAASGNVASQTTEGTSTYTVANEGEYRIVCDGTGSIVQINNVDIVYNGTYNTRQTIVVALKVGTILSMTCASGGAIRVYRLANA